MTALYGNNFLYIKLQSISLHEVFLATGTQPTYKHMSFWMALPKREHKMFWEQFLVKRRTN